MLIVNARVLKLSLPIDDFEMLTCQKLIEGENLLLRFMVLFKSIIST
jgi:hypothetical protein